MTRAAALEFVPSPNTITQPVTKFGGQPVWIVEPQWPHSLQTGNPMRFICQIALDESIFPGEPGKMAYIFMTDEEEYVDGTWETDGGENAVIIQPGLIPGNIKTSASSVGPTLYQMAEVPGKSRLIERTCEFGVTCTALDDPDFQPADIRRAWGDGEFEKYAAALDGNKVGGTPIFLQGDEFPEGDDWRLLLQLDSTRVPFYVNFGDAGIAYAFINTKGTSGKLLWQCA